MVARLPPPLQKKGMSLNATDMCVYCFLFVPLCFFVLSLCFVSLFCFFVVFLCCVSLFFVLFFFVVLVVFFQLF